MDDSAKTAAYRRKKTGEGGDVYFGMVWSGRDRLCHAVASSHSFLPSLQLANSCW